MRKASLAFAVLLAIGVFPSAKRAQESGRAVTQGEIKAIVQAIEDEIYDYGYQGWGYDYVGRAIGQDTWRIRLYIEPHLEKGKDGGLVIYKLMPFGEVFRWFWIKRNGLVMLDDDPEFGFSPERPSYLTLYLDDDTLCRYKHDWLKSSFVISLQPSAERLREAAERQKKRIGHSVREEPGWRFVPEGQDPRCPPAPAGAPPARKAQPRR